MTPDGSFVDSVVCQGAAQELRTTEQVVQWVEVKTLILGGWCIGAPGPVLAKAAGGAGCWSCDPGVAGGKLTVSSVQFSRSLGHDYL